MYFNKVNGMKIAVVLFLAGVSLFVYSLTLLPYTDRELFMERYNNIPMGQSEEYWKLRGEMLTPKYQLQDYGITLMVAAVIAFIITRGERVRIESPKSRARLLALGIFLPFITGVGNAYDLFQLLFRGENPWWADSIGIPLMGIPVLVVLLLIWSMVHLVFIKGHNRMPAAITKASAGTSVWLIIVMVLTAIPTIICTGFGQYWYAIPGLLWLYYYLSIGAIMAGGRDVESAAPGNISAT